MHQNNISALMHRIHGERERFIEIHDKVFCASWWRTLPIPGVFQKIDFEKHYETLSRIQKNLLEVQSESAQLLGYTSEIERYYVATILEYVGALLGVVNQLSQVIAKLKANKYRWVDLWGTYRSEIHSYEHLRNTCSSIGAELNRARDNYERPGFNTQY